MEKEMNAKKAKVVKRRPEPVEGLPFYVCRVVIAFLISIICKQDAL
jgi:hypothetical protein